MCVWGGGGGGILQLVGVFSLSISLPVLALTASRGASVLMYPGLRNHSTCKRRNISNESVL